MPRGPVSIPFSRMRAGFPATKQFAGTSFITTLAAATTQLSPILTPGIDDAARTHATFFSPPRYQPEASVHNRE